MRGLRCEAPRVFSCPFGRRVRATWAASWWSGGSVWDRGRAGSWGAARLFGCAGEAISDARFGEWRGWRSPAGALGVAGRRRRVALEARTRVRGSVECLDARTKRGGAAGDRPDTARRSHRRSRTFARGAQARSENERCLCVFSRGSRAAALMTPGAVPNRGSSFTAFEFWAPTRIGSSLPGCPGRRRAARDGICQSFIDQNLGTPNYTHYTNVTCSEASSGILAVCLGLDVDGLLLHHAWQGCAGSIVARRRGLALAWGSLQRDDGFRRRRRRRRGRSSGRVRWRRPAR